MLVLRSLNVTYTDGHLVDQHEHDWGQLVYAASGVIQVASNEQAWLVPPARAVWLPPNTSHRLVMRGTCSLKTLYLAPDQSISLPKKSTGLEVIPLLRELIIYIASHGAVDSNDEQQMKFAEMLHVLLTTANPLPLSLRLPRNLRARQAAEIILGNPAADLSLLILASKVGASVRTLQRLFLKETGVHIADWRQTARLLAASTQLLEGASVTDAALASGYESLSAFINVFHRRIGMTPLEYKSRIKK